MDAKLNNEFIVLSGKYEFLSKELADVKSRMDDIKRQLDTIDGKPLRDFSPGSIVKIGDREYIVLGHGKETTAVITKEFAKRLEFGEDGDYTKSNVRKYCNGVFYEELAKSVGKNNIIEHTVKLVAADGTSKKSTIKAKVSILTTELYRRYREFLPRYGNSWWTATRLSAGEGPEYARGVCCVSSNGILVWNDSSDVCYGVRPYCILNSSILVNEVK